MAFIFGAVDEDADRRRRFLDDAEDGIGPAAEGLVRRHWARGDFELRAILSATTPVHEIESEAGWTWIVGDVYDASASDPASHLHRRISARGALEVQGQGGYYLACTIDRSGEVTLGTDALSLFPLFYAAGTDRLLISTMPGALHHHPDCRRKVSAEGLAGLLLFSHMVLGQTLWDGIRQPECGRALVWSPGGPPRTVDANPLVPSEAHFDLGYEAACELFDVTLREAVERSTTRPSQALMLSGGLDSRLLAGHLHALGSGVGSAVVFGDPEDNEVRCARGVAHELGLSVLALSPSLGQYEDAALTQAGEEQLAFTFHDFGWRTVTAEIAPHHREVVNGFLGDPIMGGSLVRSAFDRQRGGYTFDGQFASANVWGFGPEEIEDLVRMVPLGEAVQECIEGARAAFDSLPGLPFQKGTLWGLYHRGRYHVGPYAWRMARSVWSVMPYLDRTMLETGLGMPLDHLQRRRMQIDILKDRYPRLAALPLDRNEPTPRPLIESPMQRFGRRVRTRLSRLAGRPRERRTYYRQFNINNPGWRAVRRLAESKAETAHQLFNESALARYIPSPVDEIVCRDPIIHSARLKTLIGLMVLSDMIVE